MSESLVYFEFGLEFALNSVCNQALTHALSLRERVKTQSCAQFRSPRLARAPCVHRARP
jgi:hypothetical protein